MGIYRKLIPDDSGAVPFVIRVQVTSGQAFTLPLVNFGAFTPNFTVNWGDGSENEVTSSTDTRRIHTYTTGGQYDIIITGFMPGWKVNNNSAIRNAIIQIIDFGRVGLRTLDFFGCINITSIPASSTMEVEYRGLANMANFAGFMRGTGVTTIPTDIFSFSPNATTFSDIFSFTSITTIPSGLFNSNTSATSFASAFNGCTLLSSYSLNLFDNSPNVVNFSSTFRSCVSLTQPLQFNNNNLVTTFDNLYNMPSLSNAMSGTAPQLWTRTPTPSGTAAFRNCEGLGNFNDIPSNFK
jgi:hypothetical protein